MVLSREVRRTVVALLKVLKLCDVFGVVVINRCHFAIHKAKLDKSLINGFNPFPLFRLSLFRGTFRILVTNLYSDSDIFITHSALVDSFIHSKCLAAIHPAAVLCFLSISLRFAFGIFVPPICLYERETL